MGMFYKVKEREEVIIERWDRFVAVKKKPGLKFNMPFAFRKIAKRVPTNITLHQICVETKTRDGIFVSVPTILQLQVSDARQFHYNSKDTYDQALFKILPAMKQLIASMAFDDLFQAREALANDVREKVGQDIENQCGLRIIDVIVDQPAVPKSLQEAYNGAKKSEQIAKATVTAAEAEKRATILRAEGRKEELRLVIESMADQLSVLISKGVPQDEALQSVLKAMDQDVLRDLGKGGNIIVTNTGDKNALITDIQAAVKGLSKPQPRPQGPAQ
jgi:regulator of protease activity HflC (stomatin/prohibitin superfamily)